MIRLLKLVFGSVSVVLAAAIGSVAGGHLRAAMTGEASSAYRLAHDGPEGETTIAISPVFSNLLPGILAGIAGKPRPARAFLAAAATALAIGDRYEESLLAELEQRKDVARPGW